MITLSNGGTTLLLLPEVGGRIVSVTHGAGNLLKSNPQLWKETFPEPSPYLLDFTAYNGHEVWLGPQSEWWKHQNLNLSKKESALFWPPDPFISYGHFLVTQQTASQVTMVGPNSPISGVRLQKEVLVDASGQVQFSVTATNIRSSAVKWDLWMLTRTWGSNPTFVPVTSSADVQVGPPTHSYEGVAPWQVEKGYFRFIPSGRDKSFEACTAKAFLWPSRPFIATLVDQQLLVIRFTHHQRTLLHPEQTEVELYNYASDDDSSLMEMEYHAPYCTLQPGQTMSASEVWQILPCPGGVADEPALFRLLDSL